MQNSNLLNMFLILAICWLEALWVYLLVLISEDTWKQVTDLFHPNNEGMINVDIIFVTLQVGIRTLTPTYMCTWLLLKALYHMVVWVLFWSYACIKWNVQGRVLKKCTYLLKSSVEQADQQYCCPELTVTSYQQWIDTMTTVLPPTYFYMFRYQKKWV